MKRMKAAVALLLSFALLFSSVACQPMDEIPEGKALDKWVWVAETGKRYHASETCSNMKAPFVISREAAEERGYTPCQKCY